MPIRKPKTDFTRRTTADAKRKSAGYKFPQLRIEEISYDKSRYMQLLIIGDESEDMIGKYLWQGKLYVGFLGDDAVAVCVTVKISESVTEVKNLAVIPHWQHKGIGRRMLAHVELINNGKTMTLGTGETPSTLRFYRSCGYIVSHRIPDFFTDNYPFPIIEEGIQLKDMIYLTKQV